MDGYPQRVLSFSHVRFCYLVDLGSPEPRGWPISCRYISWGPLSGIRGLADKVQLEHARPLCELCFFAFALAIPAQQLFQGNSSSPKHAVEKQGDIDAFSVARLEELNRNRISIR